MKQDLINKIIMIIKEDVPDIDIAKYKDKLNLAMVDFDVTAHETHLAVRSEEQNIEYIKRFIASKIVKGCTERTVKYYATEIPKSLKKIGKCVTDINADDVRIYIAVRMQRDRVSKTTINNELRCLSSFFQYLTANGAVRLNPMINIDKIKENKIKKLAFTDVDCEKLRNGCRNNREKAIVELLLSTGCRISELCQMRIDELDDDAIIVHGKGNKDRTVYLNAKAQVAIKNYLAERKDASLWLFPKGVGVAQENLSVKSKSNSCKHTWYKDAKLVVNEPVTTGSIEQMIRKLGRRCGVEKAHPHRFRRTCATFALRRGMPIEQVSRMLGHEQIATTQIYLDLSDDDLKQSHKKYVY